MDVRSRRQKKKAFVKSIAVTGTDPGTGVSHLCLALANYLASRERVRVAYLEVGGCSGLLSLLERSGQPEEETGVYRYKGVVYYPAVSVPEAKDLLKLQEDYVILDIAEWSESLPDLLCRCDRRILLGSLKLWRREHYGRFIRDHIIKYMDKEQMEYFSFGLEKKERAWFLSHFHVPVHELPLLSDPFSIRSDDFPFLRQLLFG